ncbi:hypothetical protein PVAG01_09738 [Phlyctema vagabunda]|uniref:DUF4185 domain-containing protein n=1 Tax=Phlyctema vagabunda TaxID=108571 RepID=A0ABR4P877_9HELO
MQKLLHLAKSKLGSSQQANQPSTALPGSSLEPETRGNSARIKWPPKVIGIDMLDEVKDTNGRNIPRDLGRSITLGGEHFYMFADTFCFDDNGQFVGLTSNTCAFISDIKNPTRCSYWNQGPKEPEFIPFTQEDEEYNRDKRGTHMRVANWAFGGVIEDGLTEGAKSGTGTGWIFNDKVLIQDKGSVEMELVRVKLQDGHKIHAEKVPGLSPFGKNDIRCGNISTFIDGGWVYLLGGTGDSEKTRNVMARIKYGHDLSQISNYEYYTISGGWRPSFENIEDLSDVMSGISHGMIFKTGVHGPKQRPYMCIGVDKFLSSRLYLGVAEKPEGPWDIKDVVELPKFLGQKSNTRYCLYMHDWASNVAQGEFFITWSDDGQMGGLVVAGKLRLHMED